jgi:hypothetical protein
MTKCWICGGVADSAEHKIKKSDIVKICGSGTYEEVVLYDSKSFTPLRGPNSKLVKYDKILCSACNNSFSQPFDKAYENFVNHIYENKDLLLKRRFINFQEIYGIDFADQQVNLYKYFVKSLGCRLAHYGDLIPTDLPRLLKKRRFRTGLRISFAVNEDKLLKPELQEMAGNGELYGFESNKSPGILRKILLKMDKSRSCIYQYSEYFQWLHIFYWYNYLPDGSLGNPWVANSQYLYLGSFSPLPDNIRDQLLNPVEPDS